MQCPYCQTENRDDRETCYHCDKDISMLRLIVNKARHHFNLALEHAERGRLDEAVAELTNSIDLDRKFAPAHVVLGTIQAKRGDFEKAREAWTNALAITPELHKAHNYLERAESVRSSLPILHTFRILIVGLLVIVGALALALVVFGRPDPAIARLRDAQKAYEDKRYGDAMNLLGKIRRDNARNSLAPVAAGMLKATVESEMRQQVRMIQELKFREEYPRALAAIAELESRQPDTATSVAVSMIRADINHYYRDKVDALYKGFLDGQVRYTDLAQRVEEFLAAYPNLAERQEFRAYLDRAREAEAQRQVDDLRQAFETRHDVNAALKEMQRIAAEFPGIETVKRGRADLVDTILSWMFDQFQDRMDKRDYAGARAQLSAISGLADEFSDIVDVRGPVELASQVLGGAQRAARIKMIEATVKTGDPADAEEALTQLFVDDELTTAERNLVDGLDLELTRRQVEASVKALRDRERQFRTLAISDAEASETLANFERWHEVTPTRLTETRQQILAAGAASALKLGLVDRAEKILTRLEKEDPQRKLSKPLRDLIREKKRRR